MRGRSARSRIRPVTVALAVLMTVSYVPAAGALPVSAGAPVVTPTEEPDRPDDAPPGTSLLERAPDGSLEDSLDRDADPHDVFYVDLEDGDRLQCWLYGPPDSFFDVFVLPPGAPSVDTSAVGGFIAGGYPEAFSFTAFDGYAGRYMLDVYAEEGSGEYSLYWEVVPGDSMPLQEIHGDHRIATSVRCSQEAYPHGCDTVVVATGYDWPDALSASALAGAVRGPILLTTPGSLHAEVLEEIRRLGAAHAYVVGGTAAVSAAVEDELEAALGGVGVRRVGGADRYQTSFAVAREVVSIMRELGRGDYMDSCFIATGESYPDALAVAPISSNSVVPVVLVPPAPFLMDGARDTVVDLGFQSVFILGGEGVVRPEAVQELMAAVGADSTLRVSGEDRYATAAGIAAFGLVVGRTPDTVAIVRGNGYADALSAGPLQGTSASVMLLTPPGHLAPVTGSWLTEYAPFIETVRIIGGPSAVTGPVRTGVRGILR
jgi:putative cell wall-binding protein